MKGRHILITGASSGLGAALARHYARPGNTLLLIARNAARLDAVAQECRARGAQVTTEPRDVRDGEALGRFIAETDARMPIDMVIANAGVEASLGEGGEAELLPDALRQIRTNVEGAIATVLPLLNPMRARGGGRIVLVSSLAGRMPMPDQPTYSASKAAVIAFGEALRPVLAARGVWLTVACPGFIATGMSEGFRGWRPLQWSAARAAAAIARAADRGARSVAFPLPLVVLIGLGRWVPAFLREAVLKRFFAVHVGPATRPSPGVTGNPAAEPRDVLV
ncbi:SDR family NAD(P)-dependent oxidoreductase [Ancylobacter sp.]|uniref:SDR family NAD(P)-dependent oxidoreductase n=1 Tax=Ancylobacter sp. TaxID=1872567 RepID=UPI003D13AD8F